MRLKILFKFLLCDPSKEIEALWKRVKSKKQTSDTATGTWRMLQKNLETKQDTYDRDENFDFLS